MTTVVDVLVQAARALDALVEGVATGGSTTTIVDSRLPGIGWNEDDQFNDGTAFILYDAAGAGGAPQGECRVVSDYGQASGTITVGTAFTQAVAAGDVYGVMTDRYPKQVLVGKLNEWLAEQGDVPTEDTSLTTAASTREYTLPAAAAKRDLREVWIAQATAQPYDWQMLKHWRQVYAAGGANGKLIFPYDPASGYLLKLVYMAPHAALYTDAGVLSDYLAADLAALEVALRAARWRLDQPGSEAEQVIRKINDLMGRAALARRHRRPAMPDVAQIYPYLPD